MSRHFFDHFKRDDLCLGVEALVEKLANPVNDDCRRVDIILGSLFGFDFLLLFLASWSRDEELECLWYQILVSLDCAVIFKESEQTWLNWFVELLCQHSVFCAETLLKNFIYVVSYQ